jgi:hypothetical protein
MFRPDLRVQQDVVSLIFEVYEFGVEFADLRLCRIELSALASST